VAGVRGIERDRETAGGRQDVELVARPQLVVDVARKAPAAMRLTATRSGPPTGEQTGVA
jgi:hypothetical protein